LKAIPYAGIFELMTTGKRAQKLMSLERRLGDYYE
jgi:hypothetical protein